MNLRKATGALAATLVLMGVSTGAQAQVIDCDTLEGLNSTLTYLTFTNEEKDRPSLQGKLDNAQAKLDEGKVCDAGLKVSDFNRSLTKLAMAAKTKVSELPTAPGALECALLGSAALAEDWLTGCEPVDDPPRGKGKGRNK